MIQVTIPPTWTAPNAALCCAMFFLIFKQKPASDSTVCLQSSRVLFFFQAEDGIRDHCVTGVQTCALPICRVVALRHNFGACDARADGQRLPLAQAVDVGRADVPSAAFVEIGRASCRERV